MEDKITIFLGIFNCFVARREAKNCIGKVNRVGVLVLIGINIGVIVLRGFEGRIFDRHLTHFKFFFSMLNFQVLIQECSGCVNFERILKEILFCLF